MKHLEKLEGHFVCPIDRTVLEFFSCPKCGRIYPVDDEIPILLPPQLRTGDKINDNYKYLDNPIHPAWNAGLVTTRDFVEAQINYDTKIGVHTFSGDRYKFFRDKCKGDVVADIGCNGGGITNLLKGKLVFGLDFLLRHLKHAKKTCRKDIIWINAAAEYLPFLDSYFDTICLGEMMEHVPNPQLPPIEALRVLKKGGKLLIVNQDKPKEFRPNAVRHTMNPCNGEQLKEFLNTLSISYTIEHRDGAGGKDPKGWFVEGYKL